MRLSSRKTHEYASRMQYPPLNLIISPLEIREEPARPAKHATAIRFRTFSVLPRSSLCLRASVEVLRSEEEAAMPSVVTRDFNELDNPRGQIRLMRGGCAVGFESGGAPTKSVCTHHT